MINIKHNLSDHSTEGNNDNIKNNNTVLKKYPKNNKPKHTHYSYRLIVSDVYVMYVYIVLLIVSSLFIAIIVSVTIPSFIELNLANFS